MPVFGRAPSVAILETSEVLVVYSEPSQRNRGVSLWKDPLSSERVLVCYEKPSSGERLCWTLNINENRPLLEPSAVPILVQENDTKNGPKPIRVRYLRHALSPQIIYFDTTKEVHFYYWQNLYSPINSVPSIPSCQPVSLSPISNLGSGFWTTYPALGSPPYLALNKLISTATTQVLPTDDLLPIHGLLATSGKLYLSLAPNSLFPEPPAGMQWRGARIQILMARRNAPPESYHSLGLINNLPISPLPPASPLPPTVPQDQILNGPFADLNDQVTAKLSATLIFGDTATSLVWDNILPDQNPYVLELAYSSPSTNLSVYTASTRFNSPTTLINPQLELTFEISPLIQASDRYTVFYLTAVQVDLSCSTAQESVVSSFYNSYPDLPIPYTLPIDSSEPHANQQTITDLKFNFTVGDPPVDPGSGWPAIYNYFNLKSLLQVGASAFNRNFDPFQQTDAHKQLPSTPGLITPSAVTTQGELVTIQAVDTQIEAHTQHLYHQRELVSKPYSVMTLMFARGLFEDLILEESTPDPTFDVSSATGMVIGSAELIPAILNESYVGSNYVTITDGTALFPFGVVLPGFASVTPGSVGHQFHVSGGTPPYQWSLRRTRSSITDPARCPTLPGAPAPPYPFDDNGELIVPLIPFPDAVQSGGLPPGMILNKDGLLYGTPTVLGTFLFRLHVKDSTDLHAESTVRLVVVFDDQAVAPCIQTRQTPILFKTTLITPNLPSIPDFDSIASWTPILLAIGGETHHYEFVLTDPQNIPYQQIPTLNRQPLLSLNFMSGQLGLSGVTASNFSSISGLWLFEIQAREILPPKENAIATCDRKAYSLSIGTTNVAGMTDSISTENQMGLIPDGQYQPITPSRTYLILDSPQVVTSFPQGKSTFLRGSVGYNIRPDMGINLRPGPVTGDSPGVMNPVSVVGISYDNQAPSHTYVDWTNSNPLAYYSNTADRFGPPSDLIIPSPSTPSPPPPPPDLQGISIDDQIPIGKRIRPLWPV